MHNAMLSGLLSLLLVAQPTPYFRAPAGQSVAQVHPGGTTILPNGRFLSPKGKRLYTDSNLFQVLLSPDGRTVVGFDEQGLTIYRDGRKRQIKVKDIAPAGAFTPDGTTLLVSQGDAAKVLLYQVSDWTQKGVINLPKDAYANDFAVTRDGKLAYVADVANQQILVLDLRSRTAIRSVKGGREPYALALSEDDKSLYVANIGMFDYTVVPPPASGPPGLRKPPFGFPSSQAEFGVEAEGRHIAGLGKTGTPDAQSVWKFALNAPRLPVAVKKAVSGLLIHAPSDGGKAVGGSSPNELLLHGDRLYVANANNDTVSVFHAGTLRPLKLIQLRPSVLLAKLRGVIPTGMAMNRSGTRLYVCESGLNAVAVIDPKTGKTLGHIPTGWFPLQLALTADGKTLYVATQKGVGRGPIGALNPRSKSDERFGLPDMPGMIQAISLPADLKTGTQEVWRNNFQVATQPPATPSPIPYLPGKPSDQIKHVVFITKENHTYDGIFGGLKGANGEPSYAEFGQEGWIREKGKEERVPIMPNHIELAKQFAISDNFYMEPHYSGDGHRWLVGVYPSLWTTRVYYAGWGFRPTNDSKGRLASFESNGSQIPEDYLENGSLWEHLHSGGITFRNYGEGYELPGSQELEPNSRTGTNYLVNHPMPKALYDNTCFDFPAFNTMIPDIARADWFIEDIEKNYRQKEKPLPRFLNIALCNDHGDSPRLDQGYPYVSSYMADNDLALGRIVEYLSRQPEWKQMAIFVTQDDPGGDSDHVDRHRSFVLALGPWAKKRYVSHDHTSIMSIIKTIYLIFGLGPNNQFDALATGLQDMFTTKPDFKPYRSVMSDPRVFRPELTMDPSDPGFKKRRQQMGTAMDDPDFIERLRRGGS